MSIVTTSVIIPARNGERFIGEAMSSVLSQIEADDEILVVDDASTDRTRAVVERVSDPRVKILEGRGCGVSAARNVGLAHASGEFIAFLDCDDRWPQDRHRTLLSGLRESPECDAAYGRIHVVVEAGAPALPAATMDGKHLFSHVCSGLYRRALLNRIGLFDESLQFCEDLDFSLRLSEAGMRPLLCDTVSLHYRWYGANSTIDQDAVRRGMVDAIARKLARAKERRKS